MLVGGASIGTGYRHIFQRLTPQADDRIALFVDRRNVQIAWLHMGNAGGLHQVDRFMGHSPKFFYRVDVRRLPQLDLKAVSRRPFLAIDLPGCLHALLKYPLSDCGSRQKANPAFPYLRLCLTCHSALVRPEMP